jgi:hypothetical protein|tara:strand:- start:33 stop:347 length:315 start_codon:yes stop_codon:yes gene_type:complete
MDINELKKQSDRSFDIAVRKQNALEKAKSRMILAYEGHLFLANAETINLVDTLAKHKSQFVVIDSNDNPALITNPTQFLERLIEKNQEVLNQYQNTYKQFQTLR